MVVNHNWYNQAVERPVLDLIRRIGMRDSQDVHPTIVFLLQISILGNYKLINFVPIKKQID